MSAFWAGSWVLACALLRFGPEFLWPGQFAITAVVAVLSLGVGVGAILAMRDVLQSADELHRKVLLEAMAIALGVGMVAGTTYPMMASYELLPSGVDMSALILLMGATFLVSMVIGLRRYQ
jgi:hypothetical protein